MTFIFCNLVLGVKEKDSNEHSLLFLNKNLILIRYNYSWLSRLSISQLRKSSKETPPVCDIAFVYKSYPKRL